MKCVLPACAAMVLLLAACPAFADAALPAGDGSSVGSRPRPAPLPKGRWRIGVAGVFFGQSAIAYQLLSSRGDPLLVSPTEDAKATFGVAPFVECDLVHHFYVGLSLQYIPWVRFGPIPGTTAATKTGFFDGTGSEVDLLPQLGVFHTVTPRLRVFLAGAPGYSFVFASDLVKVYANPGTAHGFIVQTSTGLLYAASSHAFLSLRASYQWGFQNNEVQSFTSSQKAEVEVHTRYLGLHGGVGVWF